MKFNPGDMVESKNNGIWSGPMKVIGPSPHMDNRYNCEHPTHGIGGFDVDDLRLFGSPIYRVVGRGVFTDDLEPEIIQQLVDIGLLHHNSTILRSDGPVEYVFTNQVIDYTVVDQRSLDLEKEYPQWL